MDKQRRLKVYFGPNQPIEVNHPRPSTPPPVSGPPDREQVVVQFGSFVDALAEAIESDRTWLRDFREDSVTLSKDLHDVLIAYRKIKRTA